MRNWPAEPLVGVKGKLRLVFVTTMTIAISTGVVRGTEEQDESFGQKLKRLFVRPTPTRPFLSPRYRVLKVTRQTLERLSISVSI
ncbi:MAG: hypothetical protein DME41_00440 [Verrucomicrobia bacterium]|nr:MAG: hypothetical protein DME41_00440 [Verrucomicrobiota bacterium]